MKMFFFIMATLFSGVASAAPSPTAALLNVCVYYDVVSSEPNYKLDLVYSVMIQNLLGHFKEVKPVLRIAQDFKKGDLESCHKAIYIGSHFNATLSDDFLNDISRFKGSIFWINYNLNKLQNFLGAEDFEKRYGINIGFLEQFSPPPGTQDLKEPGFYKFFKYKGETFRKFIVFNPILGKFMASPEIQLLKVSSAKVLSEAEHSQTKAKTPYVIQKNKFFYIADIPFSFIHEVDRYLIFCDLLFDFLELKPRDQKRHASVRIEDVHPLLDYRWIYRLTEIFKVRHLPFSMTLIPKYVDNFGFRDGKPYDSSLLDNPTLLKAIKNATANGASLFIHGYTHQQEMNINCDSGTSGDDFEFWDDCKKAPVKEDSPDYVLRRLNKAVTLFKQADLPYVGWVPPHYQASPLAYEIFGEVFSRTMQRVRYIPKGVELNDQINWGGQFFPYTIYKDYYGQYIWPENLGNVRVNEMDKKDLNLQTAQDIVEAAKKNLVIRDAWASFFFHPYYIENDQIGMTTLEWIIDQIQALGYEFVDLKELSDQ